MKFLHTADWHLGKRLEQFSRLEEQREVLDEIAAIAEEEQVDLVLIAGDLFDTFAPASEAMDLFYKCLKRLSANGSRPVVAIAGNHDSPDRIEVPNPLARENGIFFTGYPQSEIPVVTLDTGVRILRSAPGFLEMELPGVDHPIRLILTPYANEYRLRQYLGETDREDSLRELLAGLWKGLAETYCDEQGVNILVTHLYMTQKDGPQPEEPEDEKPILHIGGAQAIFTEAIPEQIQYVALGHLHRFQQMDDQPCPVIYSGSPLSYSFSEADQAKFVVIGELRPGEKAGIRKRPLSSGKPLKRVRFPNVEAAIAWLGENQETLVELSIELESYLSASDRKRLTETHPGIVSIIPLSHLRSEAGRAADRPDPGQDIETLFVSYFREKLGQEPDEVLLSLFREMRAKKDPA